MFVFNLMPFLNKSFDYDGIGLILKLFQRALICFFIFYFWCSRRGDIEVSRPLRFPSTGLYCHHLLGLCELFKIYHILMIWPEYFFVLFLKFDYISLIFILEASEDEILLFQKHFQPGFRGHSHWHTGQWRYLTETRRLMQLLGQLLVPFCTEESNILSLEYSTTMIKLNWQCSALIKRVTIKNSRRDMRIRAGHPEIQHFGKYRAHKK